MPFLPSRRRLALVLVVLVVGSPLSVVLAQERAKAAEANYVADHLEDEPCLSDWGTNEGIGTAMASVTGLAPGGLRVDVRMSYAYTRSTSGPTVNADAWSEAEYVVSPFGARRVDGPEEYVEC